MKTHIIIPARMASTRLPNKPLADICGKPMIVHVYERAQAAKIGPVTIAAGDPEIVEAVKAHGGHAVLTDANLPSGSDRIFQAMQKLEAEGVERPDIIINAQGDEPLLPPELLQQAAAAFKEEWVDVVTFAHPITDSQEKNNPNMVKTVTNPQGRALYFSRCPIPHGAAEMKRHIGLYAYRHQALKKFVNTPPHPLEEQEKLEQLRGMEIGLNYKVVMTSSAPIGVDTPTDLQRVRGIIANGGNR